MDVSLNWVGIVVMTVACFALGALWHGPIFGKLWMNIHHGDKKFTDIEMKKAMEGMWKLMLAEFIASFLMVMALDFLIEMLPSFSGVHIAFLVWIGYVLPTMTSTVVWGGDAKKWMCTKIVVSSVCRLLGLLATGYVLSVW
jgi:Protein of unknown function (DUF1761)